MFVSQIMQKTADNRYSRSPNWEDDIEDVSVESCHEQEDPLGYRVVYKRKCENDANEAQENQYSIGASYLKNRLHKLSKAGFDAPMTEKAINMLDQKRLKLMSL